mmetsp:Transcript_102776/g.219809  ORF Transcript_102776/g.219809 Transcript_102776/m.219809 type:complete len:263 (-) Transcript_102776:2468-3256(-)
MRNSLLRYSIWSTYMGQFSSTRKSELVRLTMSFKSSKVVERGTTWPRASMLCMVIAVSVRRSNSLSSSKLQSTACVLGMRFARMFARTSVPLPGKPRTKVTPGMTFSQTFGQMVSANCSSSDSDCEPAASMPSSSAKLHGMRVSPGSDFSVSCISAAKKAEVRISTSGASLPIMRGAARSSASARLNSSSKGMDVQHGTLYSRNCACFKLCGKSQITKFWTPRAISRRISMSTSGHAMEASTGLPFASACRTASASFPSEAA